MQLKIRLGTNAGLFPLPLTGAVDWHRTPAGWQTAVSLPPIPRDHIIVPSFACLGAQPEYQFAIETDTAMPLNPVPTEAAYVAPARSPDVSAHIDCWHTERDIAEASVVLNVNSEQPPTDHLLCVTVRPLTLDEVPMPDGAAETAPPTAISQMLADDKIKQRICSPTALAMALGAGQPVEWQQIVEACYDPATRSFGAWPLAIRHAGARNVLAATEAAEDWEAALAALRAGMPVVCSIRFGKDELRDAPLASTGGHLVCLYGIRGAHALVMDPAAQDAASVPREYDLAEFARAWLRYRGAAYYFGARA